MKYLHESINVMNRLFVSIFILIMMGQQTMAQTKITEPTSFFIIHSSGNHLKRGTDNGGYLEAANVAKPQKMTFIPDGKGYYSIQPSTGEAVFLSKLNAWNTSFVADSAQDNAKFSIEDVSGAYILLRCKGNGLCLGTDGNDPEQKVYSDKNGSDVKHYWFLSDKVNGTPPVDTLSYLVSPSSIRQHFDGWGVSLCWWANMCGHWSDEKIDQIITWLVSPTGLNYSHFRYNIGGGDDPQNRNCNPHHMGGGKGLRAEMPGFKDFSGDEYHWDRDEAQRKILLKIHEKRPDAVFEAFSNSCPYYMTYSGCVSGNADGGKDNLKPEFYEEFAHYLVDVCKHYKDEYGIEFKTLEPFNESVTNFWFANGVQEGCHFDYASQIAFVRVLAPILKQSGLKTVISASDETNVGLAVEGYRQFKQARALSLLGQWNTHTYSGNNVDRVRMAFLAHQDGTPLWMSEVGAGGNGIGGNLSLTQKLFDDMRYLQPETWIDWQYMEEANDQWCTIRGSFSQQTYSKVKNFYVRQQVSRFIHRGYDIITTLNNQSLAAINQQRDTLVLVLLNEGGPAVHHVDLGHFSDLPAKLSMLAYRTSQTENLTRVRDYELNGSILTVKLPTQSITTLVIPAKAKMQETNSLNTECEYLIVPRHELTRAVSANKQGKVTIENITADAGQRWKLIPSGSSYYIQNANDMRLTAHQLTSSSQLTAQTTTANEQLFLIRTVDFPYYRILTSRDSRFGLDLSNANSAAGTTVGTWEYTAGTDMPTHRQWMLVPLPTSEQPDAIITLQDDGNDINARDANDGVYDLQGRRVDNGKWTLFDHPLKSGIYIIRQDGVSRKVFVP